MSKITACAPPRIGLTMRYRENGDFYLRREYSDAVREAGGIPLHLPLCDEPEFVAAALAELDGILLPGSDSDLDPLLFGEEPRKNLGRVEPLRDAVDLQILAAAEKMNLPVLGICYGMQAINVFRGGTLVQDIETADPDALPHRQGEPRDRLVHYLDITENSLLRHLSGGRQRILVNSHHHQSVNKAGANLTITATAGDGVIEAIEDVSGGNWWFGVQWHPELDWTKNEVSQNIFRAFVAAAGDRRTARRTL